MLVLQRKLGEKIVIDAGGQRIVITLVDVRNSNAARLGFEAPRAVRISRSELLEQPGNNPQQPKE